MKQRGGSKVQLLLGLGVTAAIILGVVRVVPVYVNRYDFEDAVRSQAKFAGAENRSPEAVREALCKKAKELKLPLKCEAIVVVPQATGVDIRARYSVQVDLIVYKPVLTFDIQADTAHAY